MKDSFLKKICFSLCGILIFMSLAILEFRFIEGYSSNASIESEDTETEKSEVLKSVETVFEKIRISINENKKNEAENRPLAVTAGKIEPIHTPENTYYDIGLSDAEQDVVFAYCEQYDVPKELVFAIMSVESDFDSGAVSGSGDCGIMQINYINKSWLTEQLGITDFLDFSQNVHCGVYMLSEYYHKYGDINQIAMCYNLGENGAIERWAQGITSTSYTQAIVCAMATLKKR